MILMRIISSEDSTTVFGIAIFTVRWENYMIDTQRAGQKVSARLIFVYCLDLC